MKFFILLYFFSQTALAISFSENYLQNSALEEPDSAHLDICLESFMLAKPTETVCLEAIKSLTAKPLNASRREILYSLLTKMNGVPDQNALMYSGLRRGMLLTHPELNSSLPTKPEFKRMQSLEFKAWKKSLSLRVKGEFILLINGKKVNTASWAPPEGVFQWSLVTESHDPVVRISSFSKFATESLKHLNPLSEPIAEEKIESNNELPVLPKLDPQKTSNKWLWPVAAVVAIGLANSLQGKKVSIGMPSLR